MCAIAAKFIQLQKKIQCKFIHSARITVWKDGLDRIVFLAKLRISSLVELFDISMSSLKPPLDTKYFALSSARTIKLHYSQFNF